MTVLASAAELVDLRPRPVLLDVRWALGDDLAKITAYTEPRQDTPVA